MYSGLFDSETGEDDRGEQERNYGGGEESRSAIMEVAKDLQSDGVGLPPSIISAMETLQKDPTTKK
jgi:hypothetical protein